MKNKIKEFWPYLIVILVIVLPWFFHSGYLFFTDTVWGPKINLDWTNSWFLLNLILKGLSFIISVAFLEKIFISGILFLILLGGRKLVISVLNTLDSRLRGNDTEGGDSSLIAQNDKKECGNDIKAVLELDPGFRRDDTKERDSLLIAQNDREESRNDTKAVLTQPGASRHPSQKGNNWLVFVLSLFALFNPFVYDRALYGQFGILVAYGFLLFVIAYLIGIYQTLNLKKIYSVAMVSALTLMFSVHFIFFLAPFYILFLIGLILKIKKPSPTPPKEGNALPSPSRRGELIKIFIFSVLIVLIINANWIFAIISGASSTASFVQEGISQQDLIAFQTSGNGAIGTFENVLMMSGFWGKDQFRYLDLTKTSGWQKSFLILIPIILYGVYLSFRRRPKKPTSAFGHPSPEGNYLTIGLIIIFISAVVLAVGIKAPIAREITLYLYNHLPLYKGLREPQKWVAVIIPIYLIFLTIGVAKIKTWKVINKNLGWCVLALMVIIIMQAPSLLWGFNRQVQPTNYPADWQEVDKFLLNNSAQSYGCSDKIIFLPWHLYMSFNWAGKIMANPAPAFFSCPVVFGTNMEFGGIYDNSGNPEGQTIEHWLEASGNVNISDRPKARYIILAKEVDWRNYAWLNNLDYLKLIKETPTLIVYELKK